MKTLLRFMFLAAFLCSLAGKLSAQDKVSLSLGIGFTEQINIGVKAQILDQAKVGLNLGWFPENQSNGWLLSIQGNIYYHLLGKSKFSDMHPWYGRLALNYLRDDFWGIESVNWWYINLRLGRDIFLGERLGLSLDAGAYYHLNPETTGNWRFGPSMGMCFFYRLK